MSDMKGSAIKERFSRIRSVVNKQRLFSDHIVSEMELIFYLLDRVRMNRVQ